MDVGKVMVLKNPFVFGKEVVGEHFCDREEEIRQIEEAVKSSQNMILYSDRRMGKTSLMKEVIRRNRDDEIIYVFIQTYRATSKTELAEQFANEVFTSSYTTIDKMKNAVNDFLQRWRPRLELQGDKISIDMLSRNIKGKDKELKEVFKLPQKVAEENKCKMAVFFDEFQEINELGGDRLQKLMRSKFQEQQDVSYLFSGSKRSVLRDVFDNPDKPFYRFGTIKELGPIGKEEFSKFIEDKFRETDMQISEETVDSILSITVGQPFDTQQLCREIWDLKKEENDSGKTDLVERAIERIISQNFDLYEARWIDLTRNQKTLLRALANESEKGVKVTSQKFIEKYDMPTTAHASRAKEALQQKGLIRKDRTFIDKFFEEWIRKNML